jgi:hypothetical protein
MAKQCRTAGLVVAAGLLATTFASGISPAAASSADVADPGDVTADMKVVAASLGSAPFRASV